MLKQNKSSSYDFSVTIFFSRYIRSENVKVYPELKQRTIKAQTSLYACEINLIEMQHFSSIS